MALVSRAKAYSSACKKKKKGILSVICGTYSMGFAADKNDLFGKVTVGRILTFLKSLADASSPTFPFFCGRVSRSSLHQGHHLSLLSAKGDPKIKRISGGYFL